ncbi:conserved hypothetical protein [Magnetospirillum sp. LM-5]|uniref:DUF2934 domain-containing protein n=1 Tax=Magnetospirillum sp. LM-5 TaxID=2681466 RepID=UPI00137F956A|nr:DUF2934 domain-containing protein [Magnetospirillum sp. LM-5]CAA7621444.1 conserved hypothetical protein [Magnetospirillum sp. LM-5]
MSFAAIPVRLSLEESSAVALLEAAEELSTAHDAERFVAALDTNHRVWMALSDVARRSAWKVFERRLADFVMTTTRKAGKGVRDDDVETLIGINRDLSSRLANGRDLGAIRRRAHLAWQEGGKGRGLSLDRWLIAEMERKAQAH